MRIATSLPYTELEVATGNYDQTRATIDRVIIHTMVGTWQSAASLFDTPPEQRPNKLPSAAHYGVKLDGTLIHWLEEYFTAYHAGDYPMNQRSIGIEHEDNGDYNGTRSDTLYSMSAKLVRDICQYYNIPIDRAHILKHSEVIATGCPDALDIDRIVREAAGSLTPTPAPTDPLAACLAQHTQLVQACDDKDAQIKKQNQLIDSLNAITQTLTTQRDEAQKQVTVLQPASDKLPALQAQLAQAEKDRSDALAAQENQNRTIGQLKTTSYTTASTGTLINELLTRLANRVTRR